MTRADRLITDCRLATMTEGGAAYGAIEDGAMLVRDGRIVWAGARADLPAHEAATRASLDARTTMAGMGNSATAAAHDAAVRPGASYDGDDGLRLRECVEKA